MLPSASESLPSRTQKKLLTFSGSSVASGARISARTSGLDAEALGDVEQLLDEEVGAADHRPEPDQRAGARRGRAPGSARRSARRSKISGSSVSSLLHLAAAAQGAGDVERVGEQEEDPDRDPQRRRRAPGEQPGQREEGEEEEQVALERRPWTRELQALLASARGRGRRRARPGPSPASRAGRGRRRSPRSRRRRRPRSAPSRATIEISVSGIAVPTAARRLPTAPSPSSQPVADPLDRVGEEQRAGEDDREAGEEQDGFHRPSLWQPPGRAAQA